MNKAFKALNNLNIDEIVDLEPCTSAGLLLLEAARDPHHDQAQVHLQTTEHRQGLAVCLERNVSAEACDVLDTYPETCHPLTVAVEPSGNWTFFDRPRARGKLSISHRRTRWIISLSHCPEFNGFFLLCYALLCFSLLCQQCCALRCFAMLCFPM